MFIAKNKQKEKKGRFSKETLPIKRGVDINFKFIDSEFLDKKTPSKQIFKNRSTSSGSKTIKSNKRKNVKRK